MAIKGFLIRPKYDSYPYNFLSYIYILILQTKHALDMTTTKCCRNQGQGMVFWNRYLNLHTF